MRVHRSCHHCDTIFGTNKVCDKCEHVRCKKCPRHPVKKHVNGLGSVTTLDQEDKEGDGDGVVAGMEGPLRQRHRRAGEPLTDSSGQEQEKVRVYKPIKQRIRRTCHKCQTLFIPATSTACQNCAHKRCTKCPRDPAKKDKYPAGYPGDAPAQDSDSETQVCASSRKRRVHKKPRMRVRWFCEGCETLFIQGVRICVKCSHRRCNSCTRHP